MTFEISRQGSAKRLTKMARDKKPGHIMRPAHVNATNFSLKRAIFSIKLFQKLIWLPG